MQKILSLFKQVKHFELKYRQKIKATHPATRRRGDVVTTSLCTSQRRRSYVLNETPNDVSMERRQDVSVVRLHHILLERREDISRGRNNGVSNKTPNDVSLVCQQDVSVVRIHDVPLVRPHDFSCKSQMKRPLTSLWQVSTTSQSYVVATPCQQDSNTSSSYFVMTSFWQLSTSDLSIKSSTKILQYQLQGKQEE